MKISYNIASALLFILILPNMVSASSINITGAEATFNPNLSGVSIPTNPVPLKNIFIVNADSSFSKDLMQVNIPTLPIPLENLFTLNTEAEFRKDLTGVSIDTIPYPVSELFIHLAESELSKDMSYPRNLINDSNPPVISNITITNIKENSATIKWDTDEFADSLVEYGTSSGVYTKQEYDELFVKNHSVSLSNLSPGTKYYFVVKSTDLSGNSAVSSEYNFITAGTINQPPIASFTYSPQNPVVSEEIIFDASSSTDPDGKIISYEWEFGDGNITNTTEKIITHSYSSANDYTMNLTVTDDDDAKNSTSKVITISELGNIFDTGEGTYPSISGTHNGTITPNADIIVSKLYTYPCVGTGGHTEYVRIWGNGIDVSGTWGSYGGDWHNVTFSRSFTLEAGKTYNYTIRTGSYPQIHHMNALLTANGWINCTSFTDVNGRVYYDWIPAIKLYA